MSDAATKDLAARLERFLSEQLGARVRLVAARPLAGGASRDTWAVDVEVDGGADAGRQALVVRRDMGGEIHDQALSREQEFRVLSVAHAGGVLAPRPRWVCSDPAVLGARFLIMDRLEGESVGRRVVREPALAEARKQLPRQMGEQLARIHGLSPDGLEFLPRPAAGRSPALEAVERSVRQLTELGESHPVLELGLRWLRARAPGCAAPRLVHGDFRVGNLMVGPSGLVGVFDWEFTHIGDPAEDLAWPCVRSWRFGQDDRKLGGVGDPEEFFTAYETAGGSAVDRAAVAYWEVMGNLRWALGCVAQAHRHLSGQMESVELASLGRRACEMELELLDLIERAG